MTDFIKVKLKIANISLDDNEYQRVQKLKDLGIDSPEAEISTEIKEVSGYIKISEITSVMEMSDYSTEVIAAGEIYVVSESIQDVINKIEGIYSYKRDNR